MKKLFSKLNLNLKLKLLGVGSVITLLLIGLQNCNPYISTYEKNGKLTLGSLSAGPVLAQKSFYENWSSFVAEIKCPTSSVKSLSEDDFKFIQNAEAVFIKNRYIVIHAQPVDFSGNLSHFQEISHEFNNSGKSFRAATSLTVFGFEDADICFLEKKLKDAFNKSVEFNLPLLVHVDFEWFLDSRPDIWNWYLPDSPGYNENNRYKVEWSNWNTPVQKFGIFWNAEGMIRKAHVCYSNPNIQLEVVQKARFISSLINEWRLKLAKMNKSYLFVGVDPGWETGIQNYSNFEAAKKAGVADNLGYCALHYEGYSETNLPANPEEVLVDVVRKYVNFESQIFYEARIPKNKIFTHIAAFDGDSLTGPHPGAPFRQRSPVDLAINDYSTPGYSLYPDVYFPDSISRNIKGREWSIIETAYSGFEHLFRFAGDPNLKNINIYSWDMVKIEGQIQNIKNLMDFPITTSDATDASKAGDIIGWIDNVSLSGSKYFVSGWACANGYELSVGLHIYANGPYPSGTILTGSEKTNISAEIGVANACSTGVNKPLRFSVEIPSSVIQSYGGNPIYIYGIHPSGVGSRNKLLGNSGNLKIPISTVNSVPPSPGSVPTGSPVAGDITGWIDGVNSSGGKYFVSGWACAKGYDQSVGLHIYANGPYPSGTILTGSEKTNINAEIGVANACSTGVNKPLRFSVEIPSNVIQSYGGKAIYIYGIHPSGVGSRNKLLGNSGNLKIPISTIISIPPASSPGPVPADSPVAGDITGWVDGVISSGGKQYVSGWACAKGYDQSVVLHIYANGPYPSGTILTSSEKTNINAEIGVANACSTGVNKPLRFNIEIPLSIKQKYGGQTIYIYGIHPSGDGSRNKLLGNSGNLKIPVP